MPEGSSPDPTAEPAAPPVGRVVELDALRGLAALAVLAFHYLSLYPRLFAPQVGTPPLVRHLEYGVELFFVISGFVISMTVVRRRTVGSFAAARFARLYPVYWASLAVTVLVARDLRIPGRTEGAGQVLVNLTMVGGFFDVPYVDSAYWSLTVELGFYLTVAALLALGRVHRTFEVVLAVAVAYAGVNVVNQLHSMEWLMVPIETHLTFVRYAHLFAAGIAFALLYVERRRDPLVLAAIALTPVIALVDGGVRSGVLVLVVTAVFWATVALRPRCLRWRPLLFLGGISYALYLVHQYVGYVVIGELDDRGLDHGLSVAVATAVALALATALTYGVERPARAWMSRRNPTPTPAQPG